ncbi:hypothetical protein JOC75_000232 [Metabacillus crassostreae]|uniref:hypothetical protein n=1 Tax=Metabacillus crassostreae TaxID=929098 RepID=UPI00195EA46E|nr:hypothetical protein [Metabacillus crassostreae]MBM7602262.1 hypothetical protein [Metabacillus crassostreae]
MKTLFIVLLIIFVLLTLLNKSKEKGKLFQVYSIKDFTQLNHQGSVEKDDIFHKVNEFFKGNHSKIDDQFHEKTDDDGGE